MNELTPLDRVRYLTGVLDASAVIYDNALAVKTRDRAIKDAFIQKYGGRYEASRWLSRSPRARREILTAWRDNTQSPFRRAEIEKALYEINKP